MARTSENTITEVRIAGKIRYRLAYSTSKGRKREHFTDKAKAQDRKKMVEREQGNYGKFSDVMSASLRADALAAAAIMEGTGLTLVEAARALVNDILQRQKGSPLGDAVEAFIKSRDDTCDAYRKTITPRLRLFSAFFEGRSTVEISNADVRFFLDGLKGDCSERTRKHYLSHITAFFTWCGLPGRDWCTRNPCEGIAIKQVDAEVEILTPRAAAAILSACDRAILPAVVIQLFCGLRVAEVEKLTWEKINLLAKRITVDSSVAKTNARRSVTISENAVAWLSSLRPKGQSGPVVAITKQAYREMWTLARVRAGYGPFWTDNPAIKEAQTGKTLSPWPANALRHTAISYDLANSRDEGKTAYQAGNSPAVIKKHYDGLAFPDAAREYFEILPPKNRRTHK